MDNKITKSRLSAFLQYEWIIILIVSVASIIFWEFVYTVSSVTLTAGQQFKFYYDESISSGTQKEFYSFLVSENTFSYDVLKVDAEALTSGYNVLSDRLSIQEGDILITDSKEYGEGKEVRAKSNVDNYNVYSFEKMLLDAESYLQKFLKDGQTDACEGQLDRAKIESRFRVRMKKDNRFRKEKQIVIGIEDEVKRITKLQNEVKDFKKLLSLGDEYFFRYTKYEQKYELGDEETKKTYQSAYEQHTEKIYGLNVGALKGEGKTDPSKYFKMKSIDFSVDTADNVVIMAFDFLSYQPDLQFECISFINTVVRECSNVLDA